MAHFYRKQVIGDADRFKIISAANGPYSEVYFCIDTQVKRPCVIKTIRRSLMSTTAETAILSAYQEAQPIGAHPQLIQMQGAQMIDAVPCILSDWIAGDTMFPHRLQDLIGKASHQWQFFIPVFYDIATALAYVHQAGKIHRRLSVSNILLQEGRGLLGDVLWNQVLQNANIQFAPYEDVHLYYPPEFWERGLLDEKSNIYSLGALLYHALAGKPPFAGGSISLLSDKHRKQEVPALGLPIDPIIQEAMAKSPDKRFASMSDFADALSELYKSLTGETIPQLAAELPTSSDAAAFAIAQMPEAVIELTQTVPQHPRAIYLYAEALIQQGQVSAAQAACERLEAIEGNTVLSHFTWAKFQAAQGKYTVAHQHFQDALAINRGIAGIYHERGNVFYKERKLSLAVDDLIRALDLLSFDRELLLQRASIYRQLGLYDEAIADYDCLINQLPSDAILYCYRAQTYEKQDKLGEAVNNYAAAIDIDDNLVFAYMGRGKIYYKAAYTTEAEDDFLAVLERDSQNANALYWLGLTWLQNGDLKGIQKMLDARDLGSPAASRTVLALKEHLSSFRLDMEDDAEIEKDAQAAAKAPATPGQQAFDAFHNLRSTADVDAYIKQFPFVVDQAFIDNLATKIQNQVPDSHREVYKHRMRMLIAAAARIRGSNNG